MIRRDLKNAAVDLAGSHPLVVLLELDRDRYRFVQAHRAVSAHPSFWALMSYLKNTPASSDPSAFCGLYSSSTLANCSAMLSAVAAESPDPLGLTPVMMMSL